MQETDYCSVSAGSQHYCSVSAGSQHYCSVTAGSQHYCSVSAGSQHPVFIFICPLSVAPIAATDSGV